MGRRHGQSPRIIAICGGSGSGKTTAARFLRDILGSDRSAILSQDSYYIDQSQRFDGDGGSVNFDHPDSLDFTLLGRHLGQLKNGNPVEVPQYDFVTHSRSRHAVPFLPVPFVIVDGTLLLSQRHIRPHFTRAIFLEASESIRFSRRLERDTRERGRHAEGVRRQFETQVKPMHDLFVEPSKRHAHHLVRNDDTSPSRLASILRALLGEHRLSLTR